MAGNGAAAQHSTRLAPSRRDDHRRQTMLEGVDVGEATLASYRGIAPDELLDAVAHAAAALRGARVLHVNATPYGGGVSELLRSTVPLLNDQGLVAEWRIIAGDEPFFQVTKALH